MSRHNSGNSGRLSPVLVRLIKAARQSGEDAEGADITGVPDALRKFGQLALWTIPIRGVFVPNSDEVCKVVARVAKDHLGLDEARHELREALKVVELFERRDPIESAQNHVQTVSEEAYFYAGLAFGVTLTDQS